AACVRFAWRSSSSQPRRANSPSISALPSVEPPSPTTSRKGQPAWRRSVRMQSSVAARVLRLATWTVTWALAPSGRSLTVVALDDLGPLDELVHRHHPRVDKPSPTVAKASLLEVIEVEVAGHPHPRGANRRSLGG